MSHEIRRPMVSQCVHDGTELSHGIYVGTYSIQTIYIEGTVSIGGHHGAHYNAGRTMGYDGWCHTGYLMAHPTILQAVNLQIYMLMYSSL